MKSSSLLAAGTGIVAGMFLVAAVVRAGTGTLSSIQIKPVSPAVLLAGQTLQVTATGTYSDGSTADITSKVSWSISNTRAAKISSSGLVSIIESAGGPGMPGMPGGTRSSGSSQPPQGGPNAAGGPDMAGGAPIPPDGGGQDMGSGPGMPPDMGNGPGADGGMGPVGPGAPGNSDMGGGGGPGGMPAQGGQGGSGGFGGGPGAGGAPSASTVSITASFSGVTSKAVTLTVKTTEGPAVYSQDAGEATKTEQTFNTSGKSTSGVKVTDKGTLKLSGCTVTTSGNTTGMEDSSFYGLNAGVLALSGSRITMNGGAITTAGTGANGAFAVGSGSVVELSKVKIDCTASGAHGVDATIAGTIVCKDVEITTAGNGAAAAISTDRGGGTVTFTGGAATTSGTRSPGIYSTGNITVSGAKIVATGSEAIVIEGKNTVTLNNTTLKCSRQCGAMLYQSFSGDAGVGTSVLTMTGGSLAAAEGPVFYITNTDAIVDLKGGARISGDSGVLIKAAAGQWGRSGSNGGGLLFKADGVMLTGNVLCDKVSSVAMTLRNKATLKGTIDAESTLGVSLSLDGSSVWEVTGTSYLAGLTDKDATLANIHDNGNTIYYDMKADANKWLGGKTHSLSGGGKLMGR
jgi:hypothetical protein